MKTRTAEEILKDIISDVEAMKTEPPHDIKELGIPAESEHWFGDFSDGHYDDESYNGFSIQWPNLGILVNEAKEILK